MRRAWTGFGFFSGVVWWLVGCGNQLPEGKLVVTQLPVIARESNATSEPSFGSARVSAHAERTDGAGVRRAEAARSDQRISISRALPATAVWDQPHPRPRHPAGDLLDERYPVGSRVVLVSPPYRPKDVRVLSTGFVAAGEPVVAHDGRRIFFTGKTRVNGFWQICEARLDGGPHRVVTSMPGGAMNPALLPNGEVVFASPVPAAGQTWTSDKPAALYAQGADGAPRRLTFGLLAAVEPTVLRDGRILFVSARPSVGAGGAPDLGLFTVNSDGSEFTAFALDHDGAPLVRRPRELADGRVVYLAWSAGTAGAVTWAETVQESRPFGTRSPLFSSCSNAACDRGQAVVSEPVPCTSVDPDRDAGVLACLELAGTQPRSGPGAWAVYRLKPNAVAVGRVQFADPAWDNVEAASVAPRPKPLGHLTTLNLATRSGILLCLDANRTVLRATNVPQAPAVRVRILAASAAGPERALGEVPVQADGSFMARVPADVALGFATLDAQGGVLHHLPPSIWVRPGENRTCIGCHEPRAHTPRNHRPLAVNMPLVSLAFEPTAVPSTHKTP
ncbi:MAG: PD40 domain-containing protein [Verrucomicrobia bacterium]|nr:PD40 domain-containing protein [Verrucomicrobiota bacterium]